MAELVVGAFITVLVDKLASRVFISRLARSAKIESKIEKLSNNLTLIQAVLGDASEKHITNTSVKSWLNQLQHLAYEIDDLLDDLFTEAKRCQLNQESSNSTSKVLNFVPTKFHARKYGHKLSAKLDAIITKLHDLNEQKNLLGLIQNVERSSRGSRRLEETSLVDESKIIGRESDKEALLGKLLGSESSSGQAQNFDVVSIVGLGGIGKTTLAQLLYNDKKVKERFELMAWVCVSDEFDVFAISKVIFQAIGGENQDFADLNLLQVALSEKLSKKRFLFVLDDVWNENYKGSELLQRPFSVGSPGSKVLVTTRKKMVASVMGSVQTYSLEVLSDEEALCLFAQYALGKPNFDSRPTIKLHGEGIVKKCGGLPLALRTLGWVLRVKSNDEEWEELLNSELWSSHNESEILPALRLSYYDLPQHLKQMFVYCCLFPKDYMFDKNELVLLWMAEGFLYQPNGDLSMECFGGKCFEELVSRSFFQHSANEKSRYTMHDMLNDLAKSVAGEFYFMLDDKNEALEKVHHFSFISEEFETYKRFKALVQRARHLRTFLPVVIGYCGAYLADNFLTKLLPQVQFLRVLSLAHYNIGEIPKSVGSLIHMRYLNFSYTSITCLPEQVGELHNLQSLLLSNCSYLSSLPKSIVKLINLRHLDITDTPVLNKMPSGLGRLTSLQTLERVIIGGVGACRISDLKGLLHLQGRLSLKGLHKVKDSKHAKEANLQQKKGICDLMMEWSDVFDNSRNGKTEFEVLEWLKPFEKLTSLDIEYYGGTKLPSWVGDPSFDCLTHLTLGDCRSCTCLPTLGHLPSLQKLIVKRMDGLKILGSELLRPSNSWHGVAFPSLEVLEFENMKSWEEWSIIGGEKIVAFPRLQHMSIHDCPMLDIVALELIKCLGEKEKHLNLEIEYCPSLTSLTFPTLDDLSSTWKRLEISSCDNVEVTLAIDDIPNLRLLPEGCLVHLTTLRIWRCDNIECIPDNGYGFLPFHCLRELRIWNCKNLKSFPHAQLQSLTSLEQMRLNDCPSLDFPFPGGLWPPNLKFLSIGGLKKGIADWGLQNFPISLVTLLLYGDENIGVVSFGAKAQEEEEDISSSSSSFLLPSSLTRLCISGFKELESLSEGLQHLTCLRDLGISRCPKLRDLPETLLPSLSSLTVDECSPELERRCKGEYWSIISQIPDLNLYLDI